MHADSPLLSEEVVVNPDGTLQERVRVREERPNQDVRQADDAVELDQTGCHYVPHVFGMMAGQTLEIVNER